MEEDTLSLVRLLLPYAGMWNRARGRWCCRCCRGCGIAGGERFVLELGFNPNREPDSVSWSLSWLVVARSLMPISVSLLLVAMVLIARR
jgi:hypothetical protein